MKLLDSSMLISCGEHDKTRFWNIKDGTETQEEQVPVAGGSLTFSKGASSLRSDASSRFYRSYQSITNEVMNVQN